MIIAFKCTIKNDLHETVEPSPTKRPCFTIGNAKYDEKSIMQLK